MGFVAETLETGEDLLKCLQVTLGTCPSSDLSFSPERWERLADLAAKAKISPLLFKGLPVAHAPLGIPKQVLSRWLYECLTSATWNNKLSHYLEQVLDFFNREEIPVILLKGVYLMDALYSERAMRTVGDIDILLHPEDKARSMNAMEELGYACITSPFQDDLGQYRYARPGDDVLIELHFWLDVHTFQESDIAGFWERSQTIEINSRKALILAPEDLLVHLCLHLSYHLLGFKLFPQALRSLMDIALLVRQRSDSMNLDLLSKVLQRLEGEKQFAIPIRLAENLFLVPPSPSLADRLNAATAISAADIETFRQHLLLSCERDQIDARMPRSVFWFSRVTSGKLSVVTGTLRKILLSRAELARQYGDSPNWPALCRKYLAHWFFMIREHFAGKKWKLGKDTLDLVAHFKEFDSLRDKINDH